MAYINSIFSIYSFIPSRESFSSLAWCWHGGFFFQLGSHEYPKDNRTLKLFVFNIVLVGRKSGGKGSDFFLPVRGNITVTLSHLFWAGEIKSPS